MPYGLYIAAEGAHAQSKRLEVVANNLANADTPGFKRDLALFQARYAEAIQKGIESPGSGTINDIGGGVRVMATETDYSPGPTKNTGIPTDFAIQGDGYFVVNKDGHSLLTRAGNFTFNAENQLVDMNGRRVMSAENSPIVVDPDDGPWQLTPDGSIEQAGNITPLAIVRPSSSGDLAKQGENLFLPLGPTKALEPEERNMVGGMLETSGIKPAQEMMDLIESTRAFEANVNMIRNYDQMIDTLVSRVLKES